MIFVKRVEVAIPDPENPEAHLWRVGTDQKGPTKTPFLCLVFPDECDNWDDVLVFVADQEVSIESDLKMLFMTSFNGYDGREYTLQGPQIELRRNDVLH